MLQIGPARREPAGSERPHIFSPRAQSAARDWGCEYGQTLSITNWSVLASPAILHRVAGTHDNFQDTRVF
jgi:hypothetical protein